MLLTRSIRKSIFSINRFYYSNSSISEISDFNTNNSSNSRSKNPKRIEIKHENEEYLKIDWGLKYNSKKNNNNNNDIIEEDIELVLGEWGDKFIVINKPAGYPVQSNLNQSIEKIILEKMRKELKELQAQQDSSDEPLKGRPKRRLKSLKNLFDNNHPKGELLYFVNRLDKWTSGLLVVAITPAVCAQLSQTMPKWEKSYRLVTDIPTCLANQDNSNQIDNSNERSCCFVSPFLNSTSPILDKNGNLNNQGLIQSFIGPRIHPVPLFKYNNSSNSNNTTDNKVNNYRCKQCNEREIVKQVGHPFLSSFLLFGSSPEKGKNKFEARNAETEYKLISISKEHRKALFEANLLTGRTHQLRIHFSESGFPIIGDPYYNHYFIDKLLSDQQQLKQQQEQLDKKEDDKQNEDGNETEMMLQAYKLTFIHPTTLQPHTLTIDPPKSWDKIMSNLN